ncbi:MAG: NifU family protein [Nocardioides sp.]
MSEQQAVPGTVSDSGQQTGGDLEAVAERLDAAMKRLVDLPAEARKDAEGAIDALNDLHKRGLVTVVRRLRDDPRGKELLFELVDEPEVRMILAMHGIIRPDPMVLAGQALDRVRPNLQGHGGDVSLDSIADGVAYIRLEGACNGCSMAAVTMRESVEAALRAGVPGLVGVEVLPNDPAPTLIPLTSIGIGAPIGDPGGSAQAETLTETGWFKTFPVERIAAGTLEAASLTRSDGDPVEVIIVNAAGALTAYVNACAHQGLPLDNAMVDATEGTLTCPWHGFCYDAVDGECMTMPGAKLEQLPLRIDDGHIWVRAV